MPIRMKLQSEIAGINDRHQKIVGHLKAGLEIALQIGEQLENVKSSLGHGKFLKWVGANLHFSERTARNYMRLHSNRALLKTASVADLNGAYRLLDKPRSSKYEEHITECNSWAKELGLPEVHRYTGEPDWIHDLIKKVNEFETASERFEFLKELASEGKMRLSLVSDMASVVTQRDVARVNIYAARILGLLLKWLDETNEAYPLGVFFSMFYSVTLTDNNEVKFRLATDNIASTIEYWIVLADVPEEMKSENL